MSLDSVSSQQRVPAHRLDLRCHGPDVLVCETDSRIAESVLDACQARHASVVACDYLPKLWDSLPGSQQRTVYSVRRAGRLTALVRVDQILLEVRVVLPQVMP